MSVNKSYVRYFLNGSFYTVGDNSTTKADGIADTSYSGEIVIEDRINGKEVLEIAKYAFQRCQITKVTIYAKLRSINYAAFDCCSKLEYINIPSTVTFIGNGAFYLATPNLATVDLSVTVEFVSGRTEKVFIDRGNFGRRTNVSVIYPSILPPLYSGTTNAWNDVSTYSICALSSLNFYTKTATTDFSKCPVPQFVDRVSTYKARNVCTCNTNRRQRCFIISSLLISLLTESIPDIITPKTK